MAFTAKRSITIDHTLCGAGNSTDFPMLFSGTYTYLKVTGSGGDVTQSDGDDIVFASTSASPLSNLLKWEIEYYDPTTGLIVVWIKIPTLNASSDTVIYLHYGDSGVTTFQGDVNGTWNSGYRIVQHMPDGSSLTVLDSTSIGANGSVTGGVAAAAGNGNTDGCGDFNGSSGYVTASGYSSNASTGTFECWVRPDAVTSGGVIIADAAGLGAPYLYLHTDGKLHCAPGILNSPTKTNQGLSNATWYHLMATMQTITGQKIYINGVECTYSDAGSAGGYDATFTGIRWGAWYNASLFFDGKIDEFRVSNVVRDVNWALSSYNNQFDPSTFYAVSSPLSAGSGITPIVHHLRQQGIM